MTRERDRNRDHAALYQRRLERGEVRDHSAEYARKLQRQGRVRTQGPPRAAPNVRGGMAAGQHRSHCAHCAEPITGPVNVSRPRTYCSRACAARAHGKARDRQLLSPNRVTRKQREQRADGLTSHQLAQLLAYWRAEHRTCAYCPAPATTVDHVVPLIRGGDNRLENLAPCCRPCNGSKADRLLSEWHTRRPHHGGLR